METILEKPQAINLATQKIGVILNTSSGSCDPSSESEMRKVLLAHGVKNPLLWCSKAEDIEESLTELIKEKLDILIVLGGDGTINTAARKVGKDGPQLILLPGGTMNMLSKVLYGQLSWQEALQATLDAPSKRMISGASLGTKQFFVSAVIGGPALFAEARESIRKGNILQALRKSKNAMEESLKTAVHYTIGTHEGEVETLFVICPLISQKLNDHDPFFEVALIDVTSIGEVLALGSNAAFGTWRDDSHVSLLQANRLRISSAGTIPAILDGERVDVQDGTIIEFLPNAFSVLVPDTK